MSFEAFTVTNFDSAASPPASSVTTPGITTVSGRVLVALISSFANSIGATPITDSNSNTWVAAISAQGNTEGYGAIFYCENCVGGAAHTFTFTPTGSDYIAIAVVEISGSLTSGALNGTNFSVANTASHASGNVTAASLPELMVGICAISRTAEGLGVAAFPQVQLLSVPGSTAEGMVVGWKLIDGGASDQFTVTTSSSNREFIGVASFKSAATGGGGGGGGAFAAAYA